jgi:hypothetical protein
MAKAANKKKSFFTRKLDLRSRRELAKFYIWSTNLRSAETWTLREVDQKYLKSFEMWYWRRMEKISWPNCVKDELLERVNGKGVVNVGGVEV